MASMNPNHCGVHEIKKRLVEYRDLSREIQNEEERLENLKHKLRSVGSPVLTDMPKAPNVAADRIGDMVAQKEELEIRLKELMGVKVQERHWIEKMSRSIRKPDESAVIRIRYLDGESWSRVSEMLYGDRIDYLDKEESYLRQVTRLHGQALYDISIMMKGEAS